MEDTFILTPVNHCNSSPSFSSHPVKPESLLRQATLGGKESGPELPSDQESDNGVWQDPHMPSDSQRPSHLAELCSLLMSLNFHHALHLFIYL